MTDLEIRRVGFDLDGDIPFIWNPRNPMFSVSMNLVSIFAIAFEKFIVASTREAIPLIDDDDAESEADAFLRQEAQHARAHRQHLRALIKRYPGLQETLDEAIGCYDQLVEHKPLNYRLGYTAALEATFTPFFKLLLDNEGTLFAPGDERVASLFLWHFVEEVEHRSSALIIYDALVPDPFYRVRQLPSVVAHVLRVAGVISDGFNRHVPVEDRIIDARELLPHNSVIQAVARKLSFTNSGTNVIPAAMAHIPHRQKLTAGMRIALSQIPFHNPARQPVPAFADQWFARYAAGGDVSRWYSAGVAD